MKVRARKDEDHKASAVAKPPPLVLAWNARWAEGESAEGVRDLIGSALSFYDEAHFAAALKLFDQAAELRPDYDLPHHGRALVFAAVGQFVDGIEAC